jgi:hypothetical protein
LTLAASWLLVSKAGKDVGNRRHSNNRRDASNSKDATATGKTSEMERTPAAARTPFQYENVVAVWPLPFIFLCISVFFNFGDSPRPVIGKYLKQS